MTAPTDKPSPSKSKARQGALRAELEARIAEAEWLKRHYDEQLRAAFAQIASLQARLHAIGPVHQPAPPPREDGAEIERLRREVERLTLAEARYLDRIEELKEAAAHEA